MRIIAIDPGPHTGIATRWDDGSLTTDMVHLRYFDIWAHIVKTIPDVIIVERFRTSGRVDANMLDTVEIQGSITSLAWILNTPIHACLLFFHVPQQRYPMLNQAREMLGANKTKIQSHAVDALAHLLVWEHNHQKPVEGIVKRSGTADVST